MTFKSFGLAIINYCTFVTKNLNIQNYKLELGRKVMSEGISEKCLKYILYGYELQGRIFISLFQALHKKYGDNVKEIIRQASYENGVKLGKEMAERIGKNDLEDFAKAWDELWGFAGPPITMSNRKIIYRGTKCAAYEAWKKMGLKENEISELADLYCINDVGFAKGFNPNLKLVHTRRVMKGDPYCEWLIEITK
jgi:hypothetical protein